MAINIGNNRRLSPNNQPPQPPQTASAPTVPLQPQSTGNQSDGFTRYVGYDNAKDFEAKLVELYAKTKNDGAFIEKSIPNPSNPEVTRLAGIIDTNVEITAMVVADYMRKLANARIFDLSKINPAANPDSASAIIWGILAKLEQGGASKNIIKNTFLKFVCWFSRYTTYKLTNLLYVGSIGKYEIYWLYVLSKLGCSVSYVNYSDDSAYLTADPASEYSRLVKGSILAPLNIDFGKINIAAYQKAAQLNEIISQTPCAVKLLQTTTESLTADLMLPFTERSSKFFCTNGTIPVYFTAVAGIDDEAIYRNMLFTLKEDFSKKNKPLLLLTEAIQKPTYPEAAEFYNIQKTNNDAMLAQFAAAIKITGSQERTILAQKAFLQTVRSSNSTNLYNTAVIFCSWLNRYTRPLNLNGKDTPVFMYYGFTNPQELDFLTMLANSGFDVLYFCPDKNILQTLRARPTDMQIIELSNSGELKPFPDRIVRTKMATNAYNAERDLDTLLYNDNTMFRTHQFNYCENQTLKTTYDELNIMWHQEAKFRTGFNSRENYVVVPNLFAKVNGIENGDTNEYLKLISFKLSPHSVYYNRMPFFKPVFGNENYAGFFSNGKIDIEKLKSSPLNKHAYLSDSLQYLLFSKAQEVIDSGFIVNIPQPDLTILTIKTLLNMDNKILNLVQTFDFTKDIPKLVIVSAAKHTFGAPECILLVLCNLLSFDIVVYTPTGYKNLETYIAPEAFESYTMNEFNFNFNPPAMRIPKEIPKEKSGLFGRLFGK